MNEINIDLGGGASYLAPLYSLPDNSTPAQVAAAVYKWFSLTLARDGYTGITVNVQITSSSGVITLNAQGGGPLPPRVSGYQFAMNAFLAIGYRALTSVVPALHANGQWDPQKTGKWFFFLPLGLPMLNFFTVQFFHYPPLRLLQLGDYLEDPVPYRWGQLLQTAGTTPALTDRFQRYVDAVPIAAPDDQGAYMPVAAFAEYQRQMVQLFLQLNLPPAGTSTVPIMVFGIPAMAQFEHLFGANLDILVPQVANIVPDYTTPCLGATHPYHFYAQAQIDHGQGGTIGDGRMGRGCQLAKMLMQQDLMAAFWQIGMAQNPGASVGGMLFKATAFALDPAHVQTVCALTVHQGSLWYPDPNSLAFQFKIDDAAARAQCAASGANPCSGIGP